MSWLELSLMANGSEIAAQLVRASLPVPPSVDPLWSSQPVRRKFGYTPGLSSALLALPWVNLHMKDKAAQVRFCWVTDTIITHI